MENHNDLIFLTFREFFKRFPPEETIIPLSIISPEDGGCLYYHVSIALTVQQKIVTCRVYANTHEMTSYRKKLLRPYKLATGIISQ